MARKVMIVLTLMGVGAVAGWYGHLYTTITPDEALSRGELVREGDVRAVKADIASGDQIYERFTTYLENDQLSQAIELLDSQRPSLRESVLIKFNRTILQSAEKYIKEEKFARAIDLAKFYLRSNHSDVIAYQLLAVAYEKQRDYDASIDTLFDLRNVQFKADDIERTRRDITRLVDEKTSLLKRQENSKGLAAFYAHLVELDPSNTPFYLLLANAQIGIFDYAGALQTLDVVANDPYDGYKAAQLLKELERRILFVRQGGADIVLEKQGEHYIVNALINGAKSVRLLIDTGASLSVIKPSVFAELAINERNIQESKTISTANGVLESTVIKVDSLALANASAQNIELAIVDLDALPAVDGLLGMNYLKNFKFVIDQNQGRLNLQPLLPN